MESCVSVLQKAFDAFDTEKKGWIGTNMVGTILDMLGQASPQSAVDTIITEIDKDGKPLTNFSFNIPELYLFCGINPKFQKNVFQFEERRIFEENQCACLGSSIL